MLFEDHIGKPEKTGNLYMITVWINDDVDTFKYFQSLQEAREWRKKHTIKNGKLISK